MKAAAILLTLLLAACASSRQAVGPDLARTAGWRWDILPAGQFDIAAATSPNGGTGPLVLYLEGDGFAYVHPRQPSLDPTPSDPLALRLAMAHPGPEPVAWLGRPCQYVMPEHGQNCDTPYWTTRRYAPEIVDGVNAAIDIVKRRSGAEQIILVGYSGGGAIAVLLAARRADVVKVVTVAADLDLTYWTKRDGLAPMEGSLDPASAAERLGRVPQVHFTGAKDHVVGTDVVSSFLRRLPAGTPARLEEIPDFTHDCCWVEAWPGLAAKALNGGQKETSE